MESKLDGNGIVSFRTPAMMSAIFRLGAAPSNPVLFISAGTPAVYEYPHTVQY